MQDYKWLHEYCLNRFGSAAALEARLPQPRSADELRGVSDDRYLSLISLRIFRAGLKHSLVDAKWPAFEQAFFGFDPEKVVLMGGEHIERLMQDTRLIRHLGKLKSVPRNAQFVLDVAKERGSFGNLLADWPSSDIVGLWRYLAKHGSQLGGLSAPRLLRMAGKDTFILTDAVGRALVHWGATEHPPKGKRDQLRAQTAFNAWADESGRPLCQVGLLGALRVGKHWRDTRIQITEHFGPMRSALCGKFVSHRGLLLRPLFLIPLLKIREQRIRRQSQTGDEGSIKLGLDGSHHHVAVVLGGEGRIPRRRAIQPPRASQIRHLPGLIKTLRIGCQVIGGFGD